MHPGTSIEDFTKGGNQLVLQVATILWWSNLWICSTRRKNGIAQGSDTIHRLGDCERWTLLDTVKTSCGAYWYHYQSLDRLGIPRVWKERLFLALLLMHPGTSTEDFTKGGNQLVLQVASILWWSSLWICSTRLKNGIAQGSDTIHSLGDCERWTIIDTAKTSCGAYWHQYQSLDRLGMPWM